MRYVVYYVAPNHLVWILSRNDWAKVSYCHHFIIFRYLVFNAATLHLYCSIRSVRSETNNHLRSKVFHGNSYWAITHAPQPSELRWCEEKVVGVKGGPVTSRPMNSDPPVPVSFIPPFCAKYSISTNLSSYATDIISTPTYASLLLSQLAHPFENSLIPLFLLQA